jgi:hypothetical protein
VGYLLPRLKLHLHVASFQMVHAVAQLVEALRYKSESRGFDSR